MRNKIATLLLVLLGITAKANAGEIAGYDILVNPDSTCGGPYTHSTEYVGAQYPHPMLEVGFRYRYPYMAILPEEGTNLHFDTEMQPLISAFIYWKWLKLGWNFALQPINKGFNFAYNINMGRLHFDVDIAHIRNLRLINESDFADSIDFDGEDVRMRALKSTNWGLNFEYTFNKNYALLSGYDYSYHRAQLKSQGTGIVAASYNYNGFNKRHFGETEQADAVLDQIDFDHAKMNTVNIGGGYGHNLSFKGGRWVLGVVCVPYLAVGGAKYDYLGDSEHDFVYGLRAHGRVNLTYNYKKGGISLAGEYNGAYLKNDNFGYRRDVVNIRINHAFRLGEYGLKNCKTPGHQFMDWSQKVLSGEK